MKISASILAADLLNLEREILRIEEAGADYVHLDVIDGHFAPNITFGHSLANAIHNNTNMLIDAHLMVSNPENFIELFANAGSSIITVHYEACLHLHRIISEIKSYGIMAGVSINVATPAFMLDDILDHADLLLVMSVNPGFSGQKFIPSTLRKVSYLSKKAEGKNKIIECDGGINYETGTQAAKAGASMLVCGSYAFSGEDMKSKFESLKNLN
ncbi:MAG: ribulose-phosphate 3-epimerase [Eubacteriaceae bacterium]|nr:ribulose-phosphate 3-epimerase [Eubacteriaceae bacterium]